MMGASHRLIGVASGISTVAMLNPQASLFEYGLAAMSGAVGSLLPDIDHHKSKMGKGMFPISWIVYRLCEHRGITHSLVVILAMFWAVHTSAPAHLELLSYAFLAGYSSHVLADMLTPYGVKVLWPIGIRIRFPIMKSNSKREPIIAAALAAAIIGFPYWEQILRYSQTSFFYIQNGI